MDCGEWIDGQTNASIRQRDRVWLLGFVSGVNQNAFYKNALSKISSEAQIYLWMDNYCKENPLKDVIDGGYDLMNELRKK